MIDIQAQALTTKLGRIEHLLDRLLMHVSSPHNLRGMLGREVVVSLEGADRFSGVVLTATQHYALVKVKTIVEGFEKTYKEDQHVTLPLKHYGLRDQG